MDEELLALHKTDTWDLVPQPLGKTIIDCRWVYKIKTNSDRSIEQYKARLIAKENSQQCRMYYEETFSSISKMTTIHTFIVVTLVCQWHVSQLDVKNTFLNGDLQKEVYMMPPPSVSHDYRYVCNLKKVLYGLKQPSRTCLKIFLL
jgi:hypothetical protein